MLVLLPKQYTLRKATPGILIHVLFIFYFLSLLSMYELLSFADPGCVGSLNDTFVFPNTRISSKTRIIVAFLCRSELPSEATIAIVACYCATPGKRTASSQVFGTMTIFPHSEQIGSWELKMAYAYSPKILYTRP